MTCSILTGGAWGDEGKGKCITYLCRNDKPDIIARAGVGPNAGHSVEFDGEILYSDPIGADDILIDILDEMVQNVLVNNN